MLRPDAAPGVAGRGMESSKIDVVSQSAVRTHVERDDARRYVIAIVAAVISVFLRRALAPFLGVDNPYHVAWIAVTFTAWYCGAGPAILTALLEALSVWYFFIPPFNSFAMQDPKTQIPAMIGFLIFSGLIIALGETNRRSFRKFKSADEELRRLKADLESKVEERTAELKSATESLRELSGRLQQMSDDERRRIARELHDGVGQLLAALSMNNAVVQEQAFRLDGAAARALSENSAITEQISREIRTLSHLLHPPLLEVAGLASAIRWYVDGFSERSRIKVDVDVPEKLVNLSDEMQIAIFRVIQECLTNIHRHSGGSSALIRVEQDDHQLRVNVQDRGKGIPPEKQLDLASPGRTGVGFRGMRERLRQLGGTLEIQSDTSGTVVSAILPVDSRENQTGGERKVV
jgi:signal transduction histidine kinase